MLKSKFYLVAMALLGTLVLTFGACGGDGESSNQDTSSPSKGAGQETPEIQPPSGGELVWDDIPIYATAEQVQKGSWAIPQDQGNLSQVEWRYFELDDAHDVDMVTRFYKMEMPKNGWQEMSWMEMEEMNWGSYSKNNEENVAMLWIGAQDDKTIIAIMKGTK